MLQNNLHNRMLNAVKNHLEGWYIGEINYVVDKVHLGKIWSISHVFNSVPDTSYVSLRLKTPSTHSCHFTFAIACDGKIYYKTYLNTTYTANGTEYIPFNRKTDVAAGSNTLAYLNPTIDVLGDLRGDLIAGSGNIAINRAGSTGAGDKTESVLMPDDDMLMRIENVSGGALDVSISVNFYEVKE